MLKKTVKEKIYSCISRLSNYQFLCGCNHKLGRGVIELKSDTN